MECIEHEGISLLDEELRHDRARYVATGFGACCSIASTYELEVVGLAQEPPFAELPRTYASGVLADGVDDDPIELRFGRYSASASVGGSFYLEIFFEVKSEALASSLFDDDAKRYIPGQSEAAGSAALFVATEVVAAGAAAARAQASGAAANSQAGSVYLYSTAGGFALPGVEAFDPANLDSYLLPVVPVPATLVALGLVALGARARRAR